MVSKCINKGQNKTLHEIQAGIQAPPMIKFLIDLNAIFYPKTDLKLFTLNVYIIFE